MHQTDFNGHYSLDGVTLLGGILLREHLRRQKVVHYAYHQIGYYSLG